MINKPKSIYSELQRKLTLYRNEHLKHPTPSEHAFENILKLLGLRYLPQKICYAHGQLRIFDFYLPHPHKLAIEIDGGYHDPRKDSYKDYKFNQSRPNFTILRFSNDEVLNHQDQIVKVLQAKLSTLTTPLLF